LITNYFVWELLEGIVMLPFTELPSSFVPEKSMLKLGMLPHECVRLSDVENPLPHDWVDEALKLGEPLQGYKIPCEVDIPLPHD
jgi:hypothetical protein